MADLPLPAKVLIEDAVPRTSQHSYFIQVADLLAYAGWRSYMAPSKAVEAIVPQGMWLEPGEATHKPVNMYSGVARRSQPDTTGHHRTASDHCLCWSRAVCWCGG